MQFYSIRDIAQLCNKSKSTISRKLTKEVLTDIDSQILAKFKEDDGYNNKRQLFFNDYAVKYIMTLFYKHLNYYEIMDDDLYELSNSLTHNKDKNLNTVEDLINYISDENTDYKDKLDKIAKLKSHLNKIEDENTKLKIDLKGYERQTDLMDIHIHSQDEEIKYLRDEVLKEIKKDDPFI